MRRLGRDGVQRLYDEHCRALLGYARAIVGDHGIAEDLLHQVFLKLLRGNALPTSSPRAYLARAVRNAALNHKRNRRREVCLEDSVPNSVTRVERLLEPWFERRPGLEDETAVLEAALEDLPAEQREVVVLHLWGEMTFAEVASVLGIPANTAASRYRYAIEKLRGQLVPKHKISEAR